MARIKKHRDESNSIKEMKHRRRNPNIPELVYKFLVAINKEFEDKCCCCDQEKRDDNVVDSISRTNGKSCTGYKVRRKRRKDSRISKLHNAKKCSISKDLPISYLQKCVDGEDSRISKSKRGDKEGKEGVDEVKDQEAVRECAVKVGGGGVGLVVEDAKNTAEISSPQNPEEVAEDEADDYEMDENDLKSNIHTDDLEREPKTARSNQLDVEQSTKNVEEDDSDPNLSIDENETDKDEDRRK